MDELKKCPHCGGEARFFVYENGGICVMCTRCRCQSPTYTDGFSWGKEIPCSTEKVAEAWNRRVNDV